MRLVGFWLERAHDNYVGKMGFRDPTKNPNAVDQRIPVLITETDFGGASPLPTGFVIDSHLHPDIVCAVSVHEFFHMIQFEYNPLSHQWTQSIMEGGATFAEDAPADFMNRYLDECTHNFNGTGLFEAPNKTLALTAYKSCIFWRYLAEQYGGQSPGLIGSRAFFSFF